MSVSPPPSVTILQVSDLESALVFKKTIATPFSDWTPQAKWHEAGKLLRESLTAAGVTRIDLLVLNGDFIKGAKNEKETLDRKNRRFAEFAEYFILPFGTFLQTNYHTRHITIVPGNHDVLRNSVDATASINSVNERLKPFFDMVTQVRRVLRGKVTVSGAPMSGTDSIERVDLGDGAFEIYPLNSALLSGASIEMITEVLSGRGEKPLEAAEYDRILADSKTVSDAIEKAADGVEKELKDKLSSDAALVPQEHLNHLALASRNHGGGSPAPCRIAIVHHNSVPYPHETASRVKSYGFCNSGAFHEKLLDGGFRYVLHGHQHEARVFELADLSHPRPQATVNPRRIVFIGASSFGSDETPDSQMGFNLIRLSKPAHDACRADITHVTLQTTLSGGVDPASLSLRTITHVTTVPPIENKKYEIAEQLFQNCLKTNHPERYEHSLHLDDPTAESFYGELRQTRDVFQSIYAIYSISVFEPKLWGERRFAEFFLPEARYNLARAAAIAKSLEAEIAAAKNQDPNSPQAEVGAKFQGFIHGAVPGLHFRFSQPIFNGVQQSNRSAERLRVGSRFSSDDGNLDEALVQKLIGDRPRDVQNREFNFFVRTLKGPRHAPRQEPINKHDSLSIWDNAASINNLELDDPSIPNIPPAAMDEIAAKLLSRPFYEGISLSISPVCGFVPRKPQPDRQETEYKQLQEFPRIVLWTMKDFRQPQALECIEFHEYCGFPLFWLNPDRLTGPHHQIRKRYGHFSILGRTADRSVDHRARPNDEDGRILELKEMADSDDSLAGVTEVIWGKSNVPIDLSTDADHIDEFMHLVQRADIMFAADVWAISRLGESAWSEMEAFLASQNG
jgi:hypothetical protein